MTASGPSPRATWWSGATRSTDRGAATWARGRQGDTGHLLLLGATATEGLLAQGAILDHKGDILAKGEGTLAPKEGIQPKEVFQAKVAAIQDPKEATQDKEGGIQVLREEGILAPKEDSRAKVLATPAPKEATKEDPHIRPSRALATPEQGQEQEATQEGAQQEQEDQEAIQEGAQQEQEATQGAETPCSQPATCPLARVLAASPGDEQ